MLTQPTIDKMHTMKMTSLAEAFERQLHSPEFAQLSFEERVGMMIDAEHDAREQRRLTRRLQWARLRHQASLEDVDWHAPRGLDRQVVLTLGRCGWIRDHLNLLMTGPTPGSARAGSPAPSPSAPAGRDTPPPMSGPPASITTSPSPAGTDPTAGCWPGWPRPSSWSSTTLP